MKPPAAPSTTEVVVLTFPLIEACESLERSYTRESILLLAGPEWIDACGRPIHGWKLSALGRSIPAADYARALDAKSKMWHRKHPAVAQYQLPLF